ncbi:MAG: Enolase [Candidatus Azambacteria bacterium GW2011_GWA1_44_9]|uniref:Enolase n=1 Tax=Candidatus Azambacteria bacterium GW2011_GWA1_44_9 TaxID=1618610 RepID=A0A0G1KC62_9BACT|nr:MAG: Enolase [Candidatus Azambacteria bacterium GW2011_GWA1_44_9]
MNIETAEVQEILDSRGMPTVEVTLGTRVHTITASVPSGKSTGSKEALEKRDADGRGGSDVCRLLREEIFPVLLSREFTDQRALDTFLIELDGTKNKARLGANGMLAVSIAFAKLSAKEAGVPLWQHIAESETFTPSYPRLYMNVMNGGAHADFRLPFQEYIVVVGGKPREAYDRAKEVFKTLGDVIRAAVGEVPMGDEGGYSPQFSMLERPFEILNELIHGEDEMFLAIDAAATEFSEQGNYKMLGTTYTRAELVDTYLALIEKFSLRSIEDPFAEDDTEGFSNLLSCSPKDLIVVGDDLTVTNSEVLKEMISMHAGNALIVKPNQIGTLTEVYDTVRLAHTAGWKTIVSHRSGETEDSFIADLAVGVGAYGLKAGAPSQRVRAVKYERLLAIEQERTS